jgi:type IV pilus assembly protein PilM
MAEKKSLVTLNIGSQRVGMARFSGGKGSLTLRGYAFSEMPGDPSAEGSRSPQIKEAVASLTKQLKVSRRPIRYGVPGQAVFTRFVKLPPMSEDKLKDIIQFEAVQNVPFPIDEVSWDSQLFMGGEEPEVALVAIKSEVLTEINDAVEGKFSTSTVDAAPMALYNAFRFNYPDVRKTALLIDIGSRSTNLIYIDGDRVFTRNIMVGGAAITSNIGKEFQIEYEEAEAQKVQNGIVALGGNVEGNADPGVEALSQVIRTTMTRVHGEVVRTTNMYRTQQGGNAPEIAYLAGGSAKLPYMLEFFKEKLGIDVEYFNALRKVEVSGTDAAAAAKDAHALGELVGLALRDTNKCAVEIDLIPESVQRQRALNKKKPYLFTAAACLLGALAAVMIYFMSGTSKATSLADELKAELGELQDIDDAIKKQDSELTIESERFGYLQNAVNGRYYWLNMLQELNKIQTEMGGDRIWITQFEPVPINGRDSITASLFATRTTSKVAVPSAIEEKGVVPELLVKYVRLRGLYHDTPAASSMPDRFLDKIEAMSREGTLPFFKFDSTMFQQDRASFINVNSGADGSKLAYEWEMLLPLNEENHKILYTNTVGR